MMPDASSQKPQKRAVKRPYQKPTFRSERVFETMALARGKINGTGGACHSNRKKS
jgi:hypothetical protein